MRGGNLYSSNYASGGVNGATEYGVSINSGGDATQQTGGRRRRRCKSSKMGNRHAKKCGKSRRTRRRKTVSAFKFF